MFIKVFLLIFTIIFNFETVAKKNNYKHNAQKNITKAKKETNNKKDDSEYILQPYGIAVHADHVILIDYDSGQILLQKDAFSQFEPASMTKMLTAYLIMQGIKNGAYKEETLINIPHDIKNTEGSSMFLEINSDVSVIDLLKGLIIVSGNDAAISLANFDSGSEQNFAIKMNKVAQELGCKSTNFKNASGLPEQDHVSTAYDLAVIGKSLIKDFPNYYPIHQEKEFTHNNITQQNRNLLLNRNIGCDGIKTGYAKEVGYGMVASAVKNGTRLILVISGLKSHLKRAKEAQSLLMWGFNTFKNIKVNDCILEKITTKVLYGEVETVEVVALNNAIFSIPKNEVNKIECIFNQEIQNLEAPLKKGAKIGTFTIKHPYFDKAIVFDAVLKEDVKASGFFNKIKQWIIYKVKGK